MTALPRKPAFSDPAADALWAAYLTLEPLQQRLFADEAVRRLSQEFHLSEFHAVRQAQAIGSLREVSELLGSSPSVEQYRFERECRPERRWMDDRTIRRVLGGNWNHSLERAQLQGVTHGAAMLVDASQAYTVNEAIDALRACERDLGGPFSLNSYTRWVRRSDVVSRAGRRPRSQTAFDRLFGGWREALVSAGVVASTGAAGPTYRTDQLAFVSRLTDDEALDHVRCVATQLGRSPREHEYKRVRLERIQAAIAQTGQPIAFASYSMLHRRFGNWDGVLIAAGLQPLGGRATSSKKGRPGRTGPLIPDEELLEVLNDCYEEVGPPLRVTTYNEWRERARRRDLAQKRYRRLPSYYAYLGHFGCWDQAVKAMIAWAQAKPGSAADSDQRSVAGGPDSDQPASSATPAAVEVEKA